jgi:hypothetical protein
MRALTMVLMISLAAHTAQAKPPLRDVPEIDGALLDVGLADKIRKNCPDISARLVRALSFLTNLQSKAKAMGYTDAEIKAYRNSDAEKARLKAKGNAWLDARGIDQSVPGDWCRLGREEITKGSRIGYLLREN